MPYGRRDYMTTIPNDMPDPSTHLQYFFHRLEYTWLMQPVAGVEQLTNLRVRTESTELSKPRSQDSSVHFPVCPRSDASRIHSYIQKCAIEHLVIHLESC